MRSNYRLSLLLLSSILLFLSCSEKKDGGKPQKVCIVKENGKFSILRDGKIFNIKGASGYTNLEQLKKSGGNTIRIWDTTNIDNILADANRHGISAIVGIPLPESQYLSYYNDDNKVSADFINIKKLVNRLKNNPAILMWCVGNELVFPNKPSFRNFYKSFNNIVEMIHQDDPDHPVTTTMVNFQRNEIVNIRLRTEVDIISFNIFSRITQLRDDLESFSWLWDGPYIITEWGIDGPWVGFSSTAWNAKIEPSSTIKAKNHLSRYKKYMPVEDPRFLGSFIFFWGQKQEITHTWFSLFDEFGNKTASVNVAREIWTGKASNFDGPSINKITLSDKASSDNIFLEPESFQSAKIESSPSKNPFKIKWEIYPEDWFKKNNVNNLVKPKLLEGLILEKSNSEVKFKAPLSEGPYRLFATALDEKGNIANANIPFYVIKAHE